MPNAYINGVLTEVTDEDVAATCYSPPATEGQIRSKRDGLIAETDWWVMPDRTATADQLAYRQALRDITSQAGFPTNVTWPTKPEEV